MLKEHSFVVRVDGQVFELSKGFSFSRDLKAMGASFELRLIDPDKSMIAAFTPNNECTIEINSKIVAKVFFYAVSIDDQNGHVFTYYGRDRSGDLIDCSASFSNGGFERTNITLNNAISDVIAPFNMSLIVAADVGKAFDKVTINPGDSVFSFIDKYCKYRSVFPISDGVGGLIITNVEGMESGGSLIVGEGGNVITRTGMIDYSQRHSQILVLGQSSGTEIKDASADDLCTSEGLAYDQAVQRHRPLIIIAEKDGYDLDMQERAIFEVRHRKFVGTSLTYTVSGWEAAEDQIWRINTQVPVSDEQMNIYRNMLVKRVTISKTEEGTFSQITVAPSEAYDLPAYKQPSDEGIFGGLL